MLRKSTNYINLISILIIVYLAFIPLNPNNTKIKDVVEKNFFIENAYNHIKEMSKQPHYVGSFDHRIVKSYIIRSLQQLGLEVKVQKTTIANQALRFTQVENIIAKIDGSDKSRQPLVLLSHYDSAPYASLGASDAITGVAVILEGVRAFLSSNIKPVNDIIIVITDAEEIGLLGAKAFVNKHHWANNIGMVLNFEARGSSGNSYMLMETNHGNHNLLQSFIDANLKFPTSNSLAYSIYKKLPNDTDLTIFREDKDISGFNFAFIDNHFNYHTQLDNIENISLDTLSHQAHYLMPLLKQYSQIDLNTLNSDQDDVYFQVPFWKIVSYPFDWTLSISIGNLLVFLLIVMLGLKNKSLQIKTIASSSIPLFKSLTITALASFGLLKFLFWLHPHYAEIIQGFTYNGYYYIALFTLLNIAICFLFYRNNATNHSVSNGMVMPLFIWILLNILFAIYLPGAHIFILISLLGSIALLINVLSKKPQLSLSLLLFIPVILIFSPFILQLPVALGLNILPFSGLLLVLIFSLIVPSIQIPDQIQLNKWVFIIPIIGLYILAETKASFNPQRPLPNSLFYLQDQDTQSAYLFSNDLKADDWNKQYLKEQPLKPEQLKSFRTNNWPWAHLVTQTKNRNIAAAQVEIIKDRTYSDRRIYQLKITPQRKVNRLNLSTNSELNIYKLSINRETLIDTEKARPFKTKQSIAKIFAATLYQFIIDIEIDPKQALNLDLIELSGDLLSSEQFDIAPRPDELIPKPFIYTDSIITKQKINGK